MGQYVEYGFGYAKGGDAYSMGCQAVKQALEQIETFLPSLAIAFISAAVDIKAAHRGITDHIEACPLIGSSSAGEILHRPLAGGVAVTVIASPYIKAHIGFGKQVESDYKRAVQDALESAEIEDYFDRGHYLNQMLKLTAPGNPSPPLFMILFSPGATKSRISLSHEIHTEIRKRSGNRIPIVGGSSSDDFEYKENYQIANHELNSNSIAVALVESELLFGMGMSHGFTRTNQQTVVTKAAGHIVYELDGKPAGNVISRMLGISPQNLENSPTPLTRYPFGVSDVYGNTLLMVPEMLLPDQSIQFAPIMKNNQALTLMAVDPPRMQESCWRAFQKAVHQGGLQRPGVCLLFACALRKNLSQNHEFSEIDILRKKSALPVTGFYTFGEQGQSDDGFPIYSNQSISMLVFSDELNPVTDLIHRKKRIYSEYHQQLQSKINQIEAINAIGKLIVEHNTYDTILPALVNKMKELLPQAETAFYLSTDEDTREFTIAGASNFEIFPSTAVNRGMEENVVRFWLKSDTRIFGMLIVKPRKAGKKLTDDDLMLGSIIAQITSGALHKIEINQKLENKLQQIEILNQFGEKLAKSMEKNEKYNGILKKIRHILEIDMASLWFVDQNQTIIINEALDTRTHFHSSETYTLADSRIARWQIKNRQPVFSIKGKRKNGPINLETAFDLNFVSLPIIYENRLTGVLNLYSKLNYKWYFQMNNVTESIEFLSGFSGMLAIFIENRSLYQHKTFNKEIHHRVKNNLQTIASLLRMQARRVSGESSKEAFFDSIARVMSIAKVHEMLSLKEIESVELSDLISNISHICCSEIHPAPVITLDILHSNTFLPSKLATSLALVLNELIQNAVKYGCDSGQENVVLVKAVEKNGRIEIRVQDNGKGLNQGFDVDIHKHLGLTIVSTIVTSELKGEFRLESKEGTQAVINFPLPVIQQLKAAGETDEL